jgi:integrase
MKAAAMRRHENFTADRVSAFKCQPGKQQSIYWDGKTPGLGLRVTVAGTKSYIFETSLHGKTLRLTIGDVRTWSIKKAQDEATSLKALTDKGIDPRQQAADQRAKVAAADAAAKQKVALVAEAWAAYLAYQKDKMQLPHIERGKKWGARHLLDHERLAQAGGEKKKRGEGLTKPGPLQPLLQMRLVDITADALKAWQRDEAKARANNARQAYEMFRAFWRWCAARPEYASVVDVQAVENKDLRDEVPSRKNKRFDVLGGEQLVEWFKAVRALTPVVGAYLQILMLTGARREELVGLKWTDVDFKWGSF